MIKENKKTKNIEEKNEYYNYCKFNLVFLLIIIVTTFYSSDFNDEHHYAFTICIQSKVHRGTFLFLME